jgi:hypothetical protein
MSEDGSHVYFVARGLLTSEPDHSLPPGHQIAKEGADNLYLYVRDAQYPMGHTAFVAELCTEAGKSGEVADSECPSNLNPLISDEALWGLGAGGGDSNRPVQATPDGRFLVFTSYGDLTTGDSSSASQVFQYDAQTGTLVRISIGQAGINDNGNAHDNGPFTENDAHIVGQEYAHGFPGGAIARTMSDDGAYIFFQSPVQLTPHALNQVPLGVTFGETRYAQNIYEYHNGNVYLISDGQDVTAREAATSDVELLGTTASGHDVFFTTADPLVSQDTDTLIDFYDARVNGGFPATPAVSACQGEGCQGEVSGRPLLASPSSATLSGTGNLAPPASGPNSKPLTNKQKLARALKACDKEPRRKRASCRVQARRRYGPKSKAQKSGHHTSGVTNEGFRRGH